VNKAFVFVLTVSFSFVYGQDVKWETNLESALARAKTEKKIVFVDFGQLGVDLASAFRRMSFHLPKVKLRSPK